MIRFPHRIRDISFWYYQIIGWIFYAGIRFTLYLAWKPFDWRVTLSLSLQLLAIFVLLIFLRLYYRRLMLSSISLQSLLTRIVISSFIATSTYLVLWGIIEYSIFADKFLKYAIETVRLLSFLSFTFPIFLFWSALYFGIKAWRDWLNERDHTEHAIEAAQHAQLQMLRYQLNPHFLFNALNSVRALIDENSKSAKNMITELSEFLRYSLTSRNKPIVTLKDELDAIRLYLSIEQQRYEDKLQITYEIEELTEDIYIPSFLIHPIIESALRCGMESGILPLTLKIKSYLSDSRLFISVIHSGCDKNINEELKKNTIKQIDARLNELLPNKYRIFSSQHNELAEITLELILTNGVMHEEKIARSYS